MLEFRSKAEMVDYLKQASSGQARQVKFLKGIDADGISKPFDFSILARIIARNSSIINEVEINLGGLIEVEVNLGGLLTYTTSRPTIGLDEFITAIEAARIASLRITGINLNANDAAKIIRILKSPSIDSFKLSLFKIPSQVVREMIDILREKKSLLKFGLAGCVIADVDMRTIIDILISDESKLQELTLDGETELSTAAWIDSITARVKACPGSHLKTFYSSEINHEEGYLSEKLKKKIPELQAFLWNRKPSCQVWQTSYGTFSAKVAVAPDKGIVAKGLEAVTNGVAEVTNFVFNSGFGSV